MKFKLISLFILFFYFFNLQSMSFGLKPGKHLIAAILNGHKNRVIQILDIHKKEITDEHKSEALRRAISLGNKEIALLKAFTSDQNKFELHCYAIGILLLSGKELFSSDKEINSRIKNLIFEAYRRYMFGGRTFTAEIERLTNIEKNCSSLIAEYTGPINVDPKEVLKLRNDKFWLRFMISVAANDSFRHSYNRSNDLVSDDYIKLRMCKILAPYLDPELKKIILNTAKEKKCKKMQAIMEKIIADDEYCR